MIVSILMLVDPILPLPWHTQRTYRTRDKT